VDRPGSSESSGNTPIALHTASFYENSPMLPRLLFVAAQLSVPRRDGAEDTDELDFITNGLFLLVAGIVLFVLAVTVTVAVCNWRAGRKIKNARKLAQREQSRDRRHLLGEEAMRSTRFRK
jgi:hypothetical protein